MVGDFREVLGLGHDDRTIASVDAQGVALAAIQGSHAKVERRLAGKDAEIAALRAELARLRVDVEVLRGPRAVMDLRGARVEAPAPSASWRRRPRRGCPRCRQR